MRLQEYGRTGASGVMRRNSHHVNFVFRLLLLTVIPMLQSHTVIRISIRAPALLVDMRQVERHGHVHGEIGLRNKPRRRDCLHASNTQSITSVYASEYTFIPLAMRQIA